MQKKYIFDLDGTLVDSMEPAVKKVLLVLDEYGVSYGEDIVEILTPLGFKGIANYYAERLGVPLTPQEIYANFTEKLSVVYAQEIPLKRGVEETLRQLKKEGASLNVLTASPHLFTDACLKNNGVFDLFDNVWSAEDFGLLKSDERMYPKVARSLFADVSDCVMVDDSIHVIKAAKRAGMSTIGVYEETAKENEEELCRIADGYVRAFPDLLKI
ncbi:MAG: HAD family phosphatase [Clostridiales bacterium]|nr:HAD family phosphatase [Clostridiales bacterium]